MAPSGDPGGHSDFQKKRQYDQVEASTVSDNGRTTGSLEHRPANGFSEQKQPTTIVQPSLPFAKLLGEEIIKIRVGSGGNCQIHHVHKRLLSQHSAFFDAAINSDFREYHDNEVLLKEEDPLVFDFFLSWLYTSRLPSVDDYLQVPVRLRVPIDSIFLRLFHMANRFITPDLESLCYERVREILHLGTCPTISFVRELYGSSAPPSKLRRYVTEMAVFCLLDSSSTDYFHDLWQELLNDVELFSHDVARSIVRLKAKNQQGLTHPFDMDQYKKLADETAIFSTLYSGRFEAPPPDTEKDDPNGLLKQIRENIANIDWKNCNPKDLTPWPHELPSERAMRGSSWYHCPSDGDPDTARCIHCLVSLSMWTSEDKPFVPHKAHRPNCPFVLATEMGLQPPVLPAFRIGKLPMDT